MRTSARGSDGMTYPNGNIRHPRTARRAAAGFTLLEMLVVLVIAGLLVAVVTLAPSRNRRTDLAEEAQRLANLLESAGDEAQVRSMPIAWQPVWIFRRCKVGRRGQPALPMRSSPI